MKRRQAPKVYVSGPWRRFWERLRGEEVRVLESGEPLPVLVVRHPRSWQGQEAADLLRTAWGQLMSVIAPNPLEVYADVLEALPPMVVVQFRDLTPGGCLGYARPRGMESPATKALEAETGLPVGEIDIAWKLIANWQPRPLATMAMPAESEPERELRYRVALLTVVFHELEHLAFPDRPEHDVRVRSDAFYEAVFQSAARSAGGAWGLADSDTHGVPTAGARSIPKRNPRQSD